MLPGRDKEIRLQAALTRMLSHLQGAGFLVADDDDEDDGAEKCAPARARLARWGASHALPGSSRVPAQVLADGASEIRHYGDVI